MTIQEYKAQFAHLFEQMHKEHGGEEVKVEIRNTTIDSEFGSQDAGKTHVWIEFSL